MGCKIKTLNPSLNLSKIFEQGYFTVVLELDDPGDNEGVRRVEVVALHIL